MTAFLFYPLIITLNCLVNESAFALPSLFSLPRLVASSFHNMSEQLPRRLHCCAAVTEAADQIPLSELL